MQTSTAIRNETFAITLVQAGVGIVAFALIATVVAAATPLAEVGILHVVLALVGLAAYAFGRNAFGVASIANDYDAQIISTTPASKYTVR